jgi:hypothetical protein
MAKKKQNAGTVVVPPPATGSSSYQFLWAPALIALIAFILYLPASGNSFLDWDDQMYVTENPMLLLKDKPEAPIRMEYPDCPELSPAHHEND